MESSLDKRFAEWGFSIDKRFADMESSIDKRFTESNSSVDKRFAEVEVKLARINVTLGIILLAVAIPALQAVMAWFA